MRHKQRVRHKKASVLRLVADLAPLWGAQGALNALRRARHGLRRGSSAVYKERLVRRQIKALNERSLWETCA